VTPNNSNPANPAASPAPRRRPARTRKNGAANSTNPANPTNSANPAGTARRQPRNAAQHAAQHTAQGEGGRQGEQNAKAAQSNRAVQNVKAAQNGRTAQNVQNAQHAQEKGEAAARTQQAPGTRRQSRGRRQKAKSVPPVHIIPLGGLNEIGKNMTAYQCEDDILVVDCGLAFPDEEMLGVDLVIPDITWLEKNREHVRGILLTHGHEDHIGALPYVLKSVNVPLYGTRLTLGLVEGKLKEHGLSGRVKMIEISPGDVIQLGCMSVEFINVNHSVAGAVSMAITTPAGVIVQTGDFKIDSTPIHGEMIDLARFGELGKQGVLALLMDSTNAERPGFTMSERKVGQSFDNLFRKAEGNRIIVATFASNVHRVQQIVDAAVRYGRKVAVSGRSMVNVCSVATELGYLNIPDGELVDLDSINRYPQEKMCIITTGSQGEPMSALYRMAYSDHRKVEVGPNDFIIISASPIPGNEKTISNMVNELLKLGAEVVYESLAEVHVSGHACQEELKIILGLTRPKFFIPVHGEYRHLKKNAGLALQTGIDPKNILITDIGKEIELTPNSMKVIGTVPSGRVLVDGLGVGDVGSIVLRDRKHLAQDGLIVVVATIDGENGALMSGPDIVSRGFVYVRESEGLMDVTRDVAKEVLEECSKDGITEWGTIKTRVKDALSKLLFDRTKRSPMILPVIMEV
jgi:ribonuclease J